MIKKIILTSIIYLAAFTSSASAAVLTFDPSTSVVNVGETGSIKVMLDTEGKNVNAADVYITLTGTGLNFEQIVPAGSVDSSELINPSISATEISFTMLKPDTVINGTEAIAEIVYTAQNAGTVLMAYKTGDNFGTSSIGDADTGDELLTSVGDSTLTVTTSGGTTTNTDTTLTSTSSSNTTTTTDTTTTGAEVPETGVTHVLSLVAVSMLLVLASFIIRKRYSL